MPGKFRWLRAELKSDREPNTRANGRQRLRVLGPAERAGLVRQPNGCTEAIVGPAGQEVQPQFLGAGALREASVASALGRSRRNREQ